MEKEIAALRADKGRESRMARRPSAPRLQILNIHIHYTVML